MGERVVVQRVVVPLVASYALFVGMVVYGLRHPVSSGGAARPGPMAMLRHIGATAAGGYVVFLLIVLVFHVAIAGQGGAFSDAVSGGAFLAFVVAMPLFAAGSWLSVQLTRRRRGSGGSTGRETGGPGG